MEDKNYPPPFQWVEFPEGRARFSGSIRGWDEQGHDTFEIIVNGVSYYGEIESVWKEDATLDLHVISFGYKDRGNVGMPTPSSRKKFSSADKKTLFP